ncbi:phage head closure protein [Achromobacter spanius]|uniref:phage head closure protein n=1 Tax=Achromobacter spanius TaxID=217203 RepID=UPI00320B5A05
MLKAGKRNRRVEIFRRGEERDLANDPLEVWVKVGAAWASIRYVSGISAIKAGAEQEVKKASIRIPYRPTVAMGMRVAHGTDVYEVEAVLPDEERRKHVDLVCRKLAEREVSS